MSVRPAAIGMVASDMARTLAFYRRLGLDIPESADSEDHVEAEANGYRIMWDTEEMVRSFAPDWQAARGGRVSLAFECDSPAEVDAKYEELVDRGHGSYKEPWDAAWGMRYAIVEDPDGNHVELFCVDS